MIADLAGGHVSPDGDGGGGGIYQRELAPIGRPGHFQIGMRISAEFLWLRQITAARIAMALRQGLLTDYIARLCIAKFQCFAVLIVACDASQRVAGGAPRDQRPAICADPLQHVRQRSIPRRRAHEAIRLG